MKPSRWRPAAVILSAGLAACATPLPPGTPTMTIESAIPDFRQPRPGLVAGGQPDASAWRQLRAQGVTMVVNLRTDEEQAGRDEAAEVAAAGLAYRAIPVAGVAGINDGNAAALRALLEALEDADGTVLVHCASGNRVGGLLAIGAAQDGVPAEQALELGRAAGLTTAEPHVREQLGLPAE